MNAYDVHNFNIAVLAQKGVETDLELAKKIPQFNRSEPRFVELRRMGINNFPVFLLVFSFFDKIWLKEKEEALKEPNESILLKEKSLETLLKAKDENHAGFNAGV